MTPKLGNTIKSSDTPTVTVNPTHVEARLDNSQHSPNLTISPNSSCKIVLHSPQNNEFEMPIDDDTDLSNLNGMNRILAPLVRKKVSEAFPKPLYHFGPAVLPGFSGAGGLANSPSHNLSVEMLTARLGGKIPETPPNPQSYSINQNTAQSSSTQNSHNSGRWSPSGILVTNLVEHQSKITAIRISPDHRFFVSASEDGLVKVWDTQRLQRNVTTKSRLTYSNLSGNKITCMTFIKNTYSVAIGTDKGDIHIFRVDTTNPEPVTHDTILHHHHPSLSPKYNKCWSVCQLQLEDKASISCMEHLSNDQHSWLIFCTAQSTKIRCWDLRNNTIHFNLSNPIQYGIITALLIDPNHNWMLVGTNKGILTLWDLRFLISLRSWQHPTKSTIHKLQYHGPRTAWVSSGNENEVSLWDLHKLECVKVVTTRSTLHYGNFTGLSWKPMEVQVNPPANEMPKAPSDTNSQKSSFTPSSTLASQGQVRAMISLPPGGDYILTGGTDRIIRFWDLNRPEHSKWISPTPPSQSHLINDRVPRLGYYSMQHHGVSIIYETFGEPNQPLPASKNSIKDTQTYQNHLALGNPRLPIGVNMQNLSQPHQDCITEIQLLLYPTPMIITGDRMGFIKIFM
jgi:phosphoinositide-3-kinase regulatory subunit 4